MNFIIRDKVLQLLKDLLKSSYELKFAYEKGESLDSISAHYRFLNNKFIELKRLLPPDFETDSYLKRHLHFIELNLNKNTLDYSHSDINDICERDIDVYESDYIQYINTKYIDKELSSSIISLIDSNNFDSAIRKALLILTERLRLKFNIPSNKDGKELVNDIFGQKGRLSEEMQNDKREAYRDFISGIYGLIRNEYMHKLKIPNNIEADYILNIINFTLLKLEEQNAC